MVRAGTPRCSRDSRPLRLEVGDVALVGSVLPGQRPDAHGALLPQAQRLEVRRLGAPGRVGWEGLRQVVAAHERRAKRVLTLEAGEAVDDVVGKHRLADLAVVDYV